MVYWCRLFYRQFAQIDILLLQLIQISFFLLDNDSISLLVPVLIRKVVGDLALSMLVIANISSGSVSSLLHICTRAIFPWLLKLTDRALFILRTYTLLIIFDHFFQIKEF